MYLHQFIYTYILTYKNTHIDTYFVFTYLSFHELCMANVNLAQHIREIAFCEKLPE